MNIREANLDDARHFIGVFELAGRGLCQHLWQQKAGPGGDRHAVALASMQAKLEAAAPATAFVAEVDGNVVGGMITYVIGEKAEIIDPAWDPAVKALVELENDAPGTHYVNALAVWPSHQGQGIGRAMLRHVAAQSPAGAMSLTVEDLNHSAQALYRSEGYRLTRSAPIAAGGWECEAKQYHLMVKPLTVTGAIAA